VDGVGDSELFDSRCIVWRRDRDYELTKQSKGGGVLIAVRKDFPTTSQFQFRSTAEYLWVSLPIKLNGKNA
jgi:hypothetical protein